MRQLLAAIITIASFNAAPSFAQAPGQYPPAELDRLVSRIALYPDPLLAQILAASTFPEQILDASRWADDHHYLSGEHAAIAVTIYPRITRMTRMTSSARCRSQRVAIGRRSRPISARDVRRKHNAA